MDTSGRYASPSTSQQMPGSEPGWTVCQTHQQTSKIPTTMTAGAEGLVRQLFGVSLWGYLRGLWGNAQAVDFWYKGHSAGLAVLDCSAKPQPGFTQQAVTKSSLAYARSK